MLHGLVAAGLRMLGYDGIVTKGKRRAPTGLLRSEDAELTEDGRRKMVSAARDLPRNFSIASWMVRLHLDNVASLKFQSKTGNPGLDRRIEYLVRRWSAPVFNDAHGRDGFARMLRIAEQCAVRDGDIFLVLLADGRLQAIEGDRVRTPTVGVGLPDWVDRSKLVHGALLDDDGRVTHWCVCSRGKASEIGGAPTSFMFERMIPASSVIQHGYFDRFDQVRGVSPMAPAMNTLNDVYEGFDYALAKIKVSQLLGLTIYREGYAPLGVVDTNDDEDALEETIEFGNKPIMMNLRPGERAEVVESKTPSVEFQQFTQSMLCAALRALDIPFSFYSEDFTNYTGARGARLNYQASCEEKRRRLIDVADTVTRYRLGIDIEEGRLTGIDSADNLRWEWVPRGFSWIDPVKEVTAQVEAIKHGLTSRTRVCYESGLDFSEIIEEQAIELEAMKNAGIPILDGRGNTINITEVSNG